MLLGFPVVILSLVLAAQANIAHGDRAVARHHARVSLPRAPLESSTLRRRKSCNVHVCCAPLAPLHSLNLIADQIYIRGQDH
jgi:hypothetical protein